MGQDNELEVTTPTSIQPAMTPDNIKAVFQLVAQKTGEAKKEAEENPYTSAGKPKADLRGAAAITNGLKEEGIAAHKRGIVEKPDMKGGLRNNDLNVTATSALKVLELTEMQQKSLPKEDE